MGLLIIYHCVVSFQPWANWNYFIKNEQSLEGLWIIMSMINIWRIPIVFMISGMGVRFAMEGRNWKQLLKDRTIRIFVPFIFGFFLICPISIYIFKKAYNNTHSYFLIGSPIGDLTSFLDRHVNSFFLENTYFPNPGHLWFLANIFIYVLLLIPFMIYLKNHPDNFILRFLSKLLYQPLGLYLMVLPLMFEAWFIDPYIFHIYAGTSHGFWSGMTCFILGFVFISLKDIFWQAVEKTRVLSLILALLLYLVRLLIFKMSGNPNLLIAFESMCWMFAILGFGSLYLNRFSDRLVYFSKAVYPVYMIHLPVQFYISYYLMPLSLPASLKLILLLMGTFSISLLIYEYIIRRFKFIQPLFGIKLTSG